MLIVVFDLKWILMTEFNGSTAILTQVQFTRQQPFEQMKPNYPAWFYSKRALFLSQVTEKNFSSAT
jgi:hypothetical protein